MALDRVSREVERIAAAQKLQEENENAKLADSSEEDSDADNVMTRVQGTVEAVQVCKACIHSV